MNAERHADRLFTPAFTAVTAATLAFFTYIGVLVPLIPRFVENDMRGGELGVGLAIASFAGAAILARPSIGYLIERFGRRAVMIGGSLLAAVVGVAYGHVDMLPALLVLRALSGVGEAALFVGAATLIADLSPADRRAESASYFSVAVYLGLGLGPVLGESASSSRGLPTAFAMSAVFALLAAVISIVVPSRVATSGGAEVAGSDGRFAPPAGTAGQPVLDPQQSQRRAFVHWAARGPGFVLAAGMAAFAAFSAFLPDYSRSLGLSGSGGLFALYSGVCLVLRIGFARLLGRLGPRVSVTTAFIALGAGMALLAAIAETWALFAAAALVGVGMAFLYPSLMALTVTGAPEAERPRAIASFTMFFEIGTAIGGLTLGFIADAFGKRSGFGVAASVCVVGAWALLTRVVPAATSGGSVVDRPKAAADTAGRSAAEPVAAGGGTAPFVASCGD